jgi:outer membrane biosynthesis protein TonB
MKMRIIKLNPDFLMKAIQGKATSYASNLPSDVELLDIKYDLFTKQVFAIVRSDSFEDAADAYPTPELNVTYTTAKAEAKPEAKPASPAKPAPMPVASPKAEPAPVVKAPEPKSQEVKAVEEEFSPEQRELLSFTADGDCIIIKPTEYLKAEWNEINDVVRSLGGRWVKGDFYSYWEISPQWSFQK